MFLEILNTTTLILGNSHARRLQEKIEINKKIFLNYPGLT